MHIQTCEGLSQLSSYYTDVLSEEETTTCTYKHVKVCVKLSSYYIDIPSEEETTMVHVKVCLNYHHKPYKWK